MSQNWTAEIRTEEGKGASRRLRHAGKVPAIIYGGDTDAASIALSANEVKKSFQDNDTYNTVLNVEIAGGNTEAVVVKDVQRHPATGDVMHIDFQRAGADNKLVKKVPLNFTGKEQAPGVKLGGLMTYLQSAVEVSCLAKDLPTKIDVDVSGMEAQTSLRLSQLTLPEGVAITALSHGNTDYDQAVVNISKPKRKG